jgi:hypothetical protein
MPSEVGDGRQRALHFSEADVLLRGDRLGILAEFHPASIKLENPSVLYRGPVALSWRMSMAILMVKLTSPTLVKRAADARQVVMKDTTDPEGDL